MKVRGLATFVVITVGSLMVFGIIGEWALRRYAASQSGSTAPLRFLEGDSRTGWRSTADYSVQYRRKTADGVEHVVSYSSVAKGFRMYGDVTTKRRKLLIIGDSFTQAVNVTTGKTYGALLGDSLDMEVFSYGAGGFGTLQELLVLQDVVETIDPHVVLLQFCSNDFINNSFELESRSTINNNRLVRPYSTADGGVVHRNPFYRNEFLAKLGRSQLFNVAANPVLFSMRTSVESILPETPTDADFVRSVAVTRSLIARMRETLGSEATLYVFTADDARTRMPRFPDVDGVARFSGLAERELANIVTSLGVRYIPGVATAVAKAEQKGATVKDIDGAHWSEAGHAVVASALAERLRPLLTPIPPKTLAR